MANQAYSLHLAAVAKDGVIWPVAKIVRPEVISVGDCAMIDDFVFVMGGRRTSIGSFGHIGCHTSVVGGWSLSWAISPRSQVA